MLTYYMTEYGFQVDTEYRDLPVSGQGELGYRPYELMISSIVGCSGLTLRKILEKMRFTFIDIHVSADIVRNPSVANRIQELHLIYTVISSNATEEKLKKALELMNKNCGMIQSVKDSMTITESIIKA
ncbi:MULTISPECIES: OsmC family protein [Gracilibacillus]|uniref:OsmC family protein n=1 Tax=Gracilibacillus TaxID=74385 RepID=UPI00098FC838|nr:MULTISPECIES: OsmC family protein [Gracilibacillus]